MPYQCLGLWVSIIHTTNKCGVSSLACQPSPPLFLHILPLVIFLLSLLLVAKPFFLHLLCIQPSKDFGEAHLLSTHDFSPPFICHTYYQRALDWSSRRSLCLLLGQTFFECFLGTVLRDTVPSIHKYFWFCVPHFWLFPSIVFFHILNNQSICSVFIMPTGMIKQKKIVGRPSTGTSSTLGWTARTQILGWRGWL